MSRKWYGSLNNRLEENKMVINEMVRRSELKPKGTYEEMVTFQLGAIASMLSDISKSLAVIADNKENKQTYYDVDKVIEELEEKASGPIYQAINKDVAIEIVKRGGVRKETNKWKE